jgi:hypothetical protein
MENRKQPRVQIGTPLPEVELRQSASQAVLNEIVGEYNVTGQRPRIAPKARDLGLDRLTRIRHESLPMLAAIDPGADLCATKPIARM